MAFLVPLVVAGERVQLVGAVDWLGIGSGWLSTGTHSYGRLHVRI